MSGHAAYLSLGSNIRPEHHLPLAVLALADCGRLMAISHAWQSPAFGSQGQPDYLNAAVQIETSADPQEWYDVWIPRIEQKLCRVRDPQDRFAARTIDVDLSLYDGEQLEVAGHTLPDPELLEQAYVAVPLAEIAPDYRHPVTRTTLLSIARRLSRSEHGSRLQPRQDVALTGALQDGGYALPRQGNLLHLAR